MALFAELSTAFWSGSCMIEKFFDCTHIYMYVCMRLPCCIYSRTNGKSNNIAVKSKLCAQKQHFKSNDIHIGLESLSLSLIDTHIQT